MTSINVLVFGLLLLAQVENVYSDTGICYQCKDLLNQPQCETSYVASGCKWTPAMGSTPASCKAGATPTPSSNSSASQPSTPSCANQPLCNGMEGSSATLTCYLDANSTCKSIDDNKPCTSYTSSGQCGVNFGCNWNKATTLCSANSCSSKQTMSDCFFVPTSYFSAQACKWVPYANATATTNTTAGACSNGQATDIATVLCQSGANLYFTYNNATSTCTACTDTYNMGSNLIKSFLFAFLFAFFSW